MGHPGCGLLQADWQGRRGVSACCVLFLEERVSLQLLQQGMSPTVDVDPVHGREYCNFIAQFLQYPELRVYDLLNGAATMEFWDVIRLML